MSIYAIGGEKGGVAKTTTALFLAATLHARGRRVVLVDGDPQQSVTPWAKAAVPTLRVEHAADRERLLELVQGDADDVVIDCVGALADLHLVALFAADCVVLPSGAGVLDLRALRSTARLVEQARAMRRTATPKACVLLTRCDPRTLVVRDAVELVERELHLTIVGTVRSSVAVVDAAAQGHLPGGPAGDDLAAAVSRIIEFANAKEAHA